MINVPAPAPPAPTAPAAVRAAARAGHPAPVTATAAARTPPLRLPAQHFAAALVFLLAGSAALLVVGPELAQGWYLTPRAAAVTHLFTLGWITTSIMGALYQLLPVAVERPIASERVADVTFVLYAGGLAAFVGGLAAVRPAVLLAGALVLGCGVLLFMGNVAATLRRARRRDVTWWAVSLATLFLGVTLVLGLALAGNLRWGYLGGGRLAALGVHLHVALAGWVLLVMIGVGHRLLPMFLLSHGAGDRFARAAVVLVATGSGMLAVLHHAPPLVSRWLPALLIGLGCASFLVQARAYYRHRNRPTLDPGMRLAAGALLLLGLALVLAVPVVAGTASWLVTGAYVTSAILAITLFVAAHYYRIVPFLVWFHRFGPLAGRQRVPLVHELYSAPAARVATACLATGALALVAAVASGASGVARGGALLILTGATVQAAQMTLLWRERP